MKEIQIPNIDLDYIWAEAYRVIVGRIPSQRARLEVMKYHLPQWLLAIDIAMIDAVIAAFPTTRDSAGVDLARVISRACDIARDELDLGNRLRSSTEIEKINLVIELQIVDSNPYADTSTMSVQELEQHVLGLWDREAIPYMDCLRTAPEGANWFIPAIGGKRKLWMGPCQCCGTPNTIGDWCQPCKDLE